MAVLPHQEQEYLLCVTYLSAAKRQVLIAKDNMIELN